MRIRFGWIFIASLLMIPILGTQIYQKYKPSVDWEQSAGGLTVHIREYGVDRVIGFDEYAVGVMGALLEPDTQEETMKVLAVLLRTYGAYMYQEGKILNSQWLGQPWLSAGERLAKGMNEEKLQRAVKDTEGSCILYEGKPILPLFYTLGNGKTRNFSDVWGGNIAYLTSVESVWDKQSEAYVKKLFLRRSAVEGALAAAGGNDIERPPLSEEMIQIIEKDGAGYVKQIQIGGKIYLGEDFRCLLGLPSACFDYQVKNDGIEFTCYGQGHGVGLSLYGANRMAEEGKTWKEIISWYFSGVSV